MHLCVRFSMCLLHLFYNLFCHNVTLSVTGPFLNHATLYITNISNYLALICMSQQNSSDLKMWHSRLRPQWHPSSNAPLLCRIVGLVFTFACLSLCMCVCVWNCLLECVFMCACVYVCVCCLSVDMCPIIFCLSFKIRYEYIKELSKVQFCIFIKFCNNSFIAHQ